MGAIVGEKAHQNVSSAEKEKPQRQDSRGSLELDYIQDKLENFRSTIMKDVDKRMNIMIDEIMEEIRQNELRSKEFQNFAATLRQKENSSQNTWNNRSTSQTNKTNSEELSKDQSANQSVDNKKKKSTQLPDKIFTTRESYLTVLLEIPHMKTIYHIFYIILLAFLLNGICYDYFVEGRVNFGLGTFKSGLGKIHWVLGILFIQNLFVIGLYYPLQAWASIRDSFASQSNLQRFWSYCCLITYAFFQVIFYYVASALCLKLDLPFVTASVLLLESTRLVMKMHSFVRVIAGRAIAGKVKNDDKKTHKFQMPPLSCYIYFLFAPTLIYRDSYPRTLQIRWKFALNRFLEVVAVAFLYSYIHERYIRPHFSNSGLETLTASSLIVKLFGMIMPSVVILLCGFYLILHAWLNFTSELLRFGDRMFYKDWWTSSNYEAYYRNWNVVIHDWLYEYIYKDFYQHLLKGNKLASSLTVFMISAYIHEHIMSFALQIFFPLMFMMFGVLGVFLIFITRKFSKSMGNLFLWFSLIFGNSLLISLYSMEYYAVHNCPKSYDTWIDYIKPAIWSSYGKCM